MAGFVLYLCPPKAMGYLSPMFVNVCFNFTPFLSQVVAFLIGVQPFPGIWTTYGGACLFIGCTLLTMDYADQNELANIPLAGSLEYEPPVELYQTKDAFTDK